MTDNERAVIEAAVEWAHMRDGYGKSSRTVELLAQQMADAIDELHNEHDGRWEPSE